MITRNIKLFLVAIITSWSIAQSAETDASADQLAIQQDQIPKFIRVERDDMKVRLQTAVVTYIRDGITVDLIGAIHIADADYYTRLNKDFTHYDAILFEMIGGENIQNGRKISTENQDPKESSVNMLANTYLAAAKLLQLQYQQEGIDYTAKNFVHADLTLAEFERLQTKKGESLIEFTREQQAEARARQPNMNRLIAACLSGDPTLIKLELVDTLGRAHDPMGAMLGNSVIIGDRNIACLQLLAKQNNAGRKKLGIFYGVAHLPDMEKRMLKDGFKKTAHRWLTAWDIPTVENSKPPAGSN